MSSPMDRICFYLNISPDRYLSFYQGVARNVVVHDHGGRRIQFPAERLRPFITQNGICGEFELEFDADHRFVAMRRIGDLPTRS